MPDSKKDELVRFLEERAFKPVLNAKPKGRSEAEQKKLQHVDRSWLFSLIFRQNNSDKIGLGGEIPRFSAAAVTKQQRTPWLIGTVKTGENSQSPEIVRQLSLHTR